MNVCILLSARFPTEKAYGVQINAMIEGFLASGSQVFVLYPNRSKVRPPQKVGVAYIPFGPYIRADRKLFSIYRWMGLFFAYFKLRSIRCDFVIANDPIQVGFFSRFWPVIWEVHDVPGFSSAMARWYLRWIMAGAKAIISTNKLKIEALSSIGVLSASLVLPNPTTISISALGGLSRNEARAFLGISSSKRIAVYTGQFFDWKGVDTIVAAGGVMHERGSSMCIHLVGGLGGDLRRIQDKVDRVQCLDKTVIIHGQRPHAEIAYWLRAADIVLIPNSGKFGISVIDTSPMKAYEAMAARARIFASDLPSLREALGGYPKVAFLPPDDPRAWANELSKPMNEESVDLHDQTELYIRSAILTPEKRAQDILLFVGDLLKKRFLGK